MKIKTLLIAALTLIVISCKKEPIKQPTVTSSSPPTVTQPTLVDTITLQNGKAATQLNYKNSLLQSTQQVNILIEKSGKDLKVETRMVYLSDSTSITLVFKNTNNLILGQDSVTYNRITKKVVYVNNCYGCGQNAADMRTVIMTN